MPVFLTILLSILGFVLFHKWKLGAFTSSPRNEPDFFDYHEPGMGLCTLGIIGSFAYILTPHWFDFANLPLGQEFKHAGEVITIAAMTLYVAARRALGRNFIGGVGLYQDHQLITGGPYRYVRNPIYMAYLLVGLGVSLQMQNLFLLFCMTIVYLVLMRRAPYEEKLLQDRFGDSYTKYLAQTGRFLPRLRRPTT